MTVDVFLSYTSQDRAVVENLARRIMNAGYRPWFDRWSIGPGATWQSAIEEGLRDCRACAVFVGSHGIGDWAREELAVALDRAVADRSFRVFPVLLPGLPEPFDETVTLPSFLRMRNWVDLRHDLSTESAVQRLLDAIEGRPTARVPRPQGTDDRCPYQGLRTFDVDDASSFFGRAPDTPRLVEKLRTSRFLAVIGASGSGKSSLVRAGLIPALRAGALPGSSGWPFVVVKPGPRPLEELAASLTAAGHPGPEGRLLDEFRRDPRSMNLAASTVLRAKGLEDASLMVLVDQFEEIFTLTPRSADRSAFVDLLVEAATTAGGRAYVVVTMRADFYSMVGFDRALAQTVAAHQYLVSEPAGDDLRETIEAPAWRAGLELEPGLVDMILEDVAHQPGALPLLQQALVETWNRRVGRVLTMHGYQAGGGVAGAVAARAEQVYQSLDVAHQELVRGVLVRLTRLGEGTEDTRRRVRREELCRDVPTDPSATVVDALITARLLISSTASDGAIVVDVAHEALIRGWPRLRSWLDEDRAGLRILQRLADEAREWRDSGEDGSLLLRGTQLELTEQWVTDHRGDLNDLESAFLSAGRALADAERDAARRAELQQLRQRAAARVRRRVTILLAFGLVVSSVLAVLAVRFWRTADGQRAEATTARLAAQATGSVEDRLDLALLLGVTSVRSGTGEDGRRALLGLLNTWPRPERYLRVGGDQVDGDVSAVDISRDGRVAVALIDSRELTAWDVGSGMVRDRRLIGAGEGSPTGALSVSPDGRYAAIGLDTGTVLLWPIGRGPNPVGVASSAITALAYTGDGTVIAVGTAGDGVLRLRPDTGRSTVAVPVKDRVDTLATAEGGPGVVYVVGEQVRVLTPPGTSPRAIHDAAGQVIERVSFTAHDEKVVITTGHQVVVVPAAGGPVDVLVDDSSDTTAWQDLAATNSSETTVTAVDDAGQVAVGQRGRIDLWDLGEPGARSTRLVGTQGVVEHAAMARGGDRMVTTGRREVVVWRTASNPLAVRIALDGGPVANALSADGRHMYSAGTDARIHALDTSTGHDRAVCAPTGQALSSLAVNRAGTLAVSGGQDGLVVVCDLTTGQILARRRLHESRVVAVALDGDGATLLSASAQGRSVLSTLPRLDTRATWNIVDGHVPPGRILTAALDTTAQNLAVGTDSGRLQVIPIRPGAPHPVPIRPDGGPAIWAVAFAPDSTRIAYGDEIGGIVVHDLSDTHPDVLVPGHAALVRTLRFDRTGDRLTSLYGDSTVAQWDAHSGRSLSPLLRSDTNLPAGSLDVTPNGDLIAVVQGNATAYLWRVDTPSLITQACVTANRAFTSAEVRTYLTEGSPTDPCPSRRGASTHPAGSLGPG